MAKSKQASTELETPDVWTGRRLRGTALISVLGALMLTLLLEALDQTVVTTAMPRIIGTLQGFDRYTWMITAYVLASTTMVPIVGKLSDLFGRKWFLIVGALIFLVGSLLSGAAQTMDQLILFRTIQGLGSGIGIALVFTVVGDIFPPDERARWQGVFGAVYGLSNLVGPTLGGWLADHGPLLGSFVTDATRWRWVFYINLPVGILAIAALLIFLPADISERSSSATGWAAIKRIDFAGALLAAAATICLLLGLTWGGDQTYDWTSAQVLGMLGAAGVIYIIFFIVEHYAAEAILPLKLFRNQVFTVSAILTLLQMMVLIGITLYLPFFLQGVLGESATSSGATITPQSLAVVISAAFAGFLMTVTKRYQLLTIISALLMTIGVFLMTRMDASTSIGTVIFYMVLVGLGLGTFFSVLGLTTQNSLVRKNLGVGTGAVKYLGQIGATLGIAVSSTVVNSTLSADVLKRVPASVVKQLTPAGWKAATNPQVLVNSQARDGIIKGATHFATQNVPAGPQHAVIVQQIAQGVQQTLNQVFGALKLSLVVAIQHSMVAILVIGVAMIVGTLFLKDIPMTSAPGKSQAEEAETLGEEKAAVLAE